MTTKNRKLLVVDDDPGIRRQMKWTFDNYDVVTADDREHAIAAFKIHHPAVVMLDLGLPPDEEGSSEGFGALKAILKVAPATRVVIVSGAASQENRHIAEQFGAFEFYPKPIDADELLDIVDRAYEAVPDLN